MLAETPPSELCAIAESRWREYQEKAAENAIDPPGLDPQELKELLGVWSCSDFITRSCISTPSLLVDLWCSGDLHQSYGEHHYLKLVSSCLEGVSEEPELMAALRQVRRREMVRIAWRDIAGLAELEETTRDLSQFADVILDEALLLIHAWQAQSLGVPTNSEGQEQSLIVVAMGKLGAFELNFSSDIDLIFTIQESGKTVGGRRERTSEE
ncbi:MAG: bifunctional glutamine synthetase adenylyltransferase/deadenyltransferase, partial [Gammaproteobacteria bacterium]|nr:bifunctional glutamine synthetase adenylyltransferase/deadenyltransferase [Gammaproteobacteria bacterium]